MLCDVQTIGESGQDDPYSVIFDRLRYDPLLFAFRLIQEAISNVSISGSWDFLLFRVADLHIVPKVTTFREIILIHIELSISFQMHLVMKTKI